MMRLGFGQAPVKYPIQFGSKIDTVKQTQETNNSPDTQNQVVNGTLRTELTHLLEQISQKKPYNIKVNGMLDKHIEHNCLHYFPEAKGAATLGLTLTDSEGREKNFIGSLVMTAESAAILGFILADSKGYPELVIRNKLITNKSGKTLDATDPNNEQVFQEAQKAQRHFAFYIKGLGH